jgi:hypothetical protein
MTQDEGVTYLQVLMMDTQDSRERALQIGRALITPLQVADDSGDPMESLLFWAALIAFLLGVAETSVGPTGREDIVQTMRNAGAAALRADLARPQHEH